MTGRTRQVKLDVQNLTGKQDWKNKTDRTRLADQGCQEKTARIRQLGQDSQERTGQLEQDW